MNYILYQLLIPAFIRNRIYASNVELYEKQILAKLKDNQCSPPSSDLSSVYIANLRVVADRHALLSAMPKESIVAHVGAGNGKFSAQIVLTTKPKELALIDDYNGEDDESLNIIRRRFRNEIDKGQIQVNNGRLCDELMAVRDSNFEWVYLNIDPSYESTAKMLDICNQKVKAGGLISGANYSRGPWPDRKKFGVIDAVNKFCKKQRWEMVYLTHEPCRQLSYAIKKIGSLT